MTVGRPTRLTQAGLQARAQGAVDLEISVARIRAIAERRREGVLILLPPSSPLLPVHKQKGPVHCSVSCKKTPESFARIHRESHISSEAQNPGCRWQNSEIERSAVA